MFRITILWQISSFEFPKSDVATATQATTTSPDATLLGESNTLTHNTFLQNPEVYANSSETGSDTSSLDLVEYAAETTNPEEYYPVGK